MIRCPLLLLLLWSLTANGFQNPQPALESLIDYPNTRDFTLDTSGTEAYFSIQSPLEDKAVIAVVRQIEGQWTDPQLVSFTGRYRDIEPFLSPDGLRLYYASNRPVNDTITAPKDFDIWYVSREHTEADWSEPVNLGAPVNSTHNEFYPAISNTGNLYFTSDRPEGSKGLDDIYVSEWRDKAYQNPQSLGPSINTKGYEYNAFIAPDESYILYGAYNREGGLGSGDNYISYRQPDGSWGVSKNLGEGLNSAYMDYCPFVDAAGETLYFTSRRSAIENKTYQSLEEFRQAIHQYANGFSRIYKVPFNPRRWE